MGVICVAESRLPVPGRRSVFAMKIKMKNES